MLGGSLQSVIQSIDVIWKEEGRMVMEIGPCSFWKVSKDPLLKIQLVWDFLFTETSFYALSGKRQRTKDETLFK